MLSDYINLSDEDIIKLISQGNEEAYEALFERYKKYIKAFCYDAYSTYKNTGIEFEDLESVSMPVFYNAIANYECGKCGFYIYLKVSLSNAFKVVCQQFGRNNKVADGCQNSISLDQEFDDGHSLSETIGEEDKRIKTIGNSDFTKKYRKVVDKLLSLEEKAVWSMKTEHGFDYVEISKALNTSLSRVKRIYVNAKNKLITHLKDFY